MVSVGMRSALLSKQTQSRRTRELTVRHLNRPANSPLKLTVRLCFSRRPSRLRRLEFARRRATCTGIIGCAASGAPLDAVRPKAARSLMSGRWDDTESHLARSSPALSRALPLDRESAFTVREPRTSQSHPETLKSNCRSRGVKQFTMLRSAFRLYANPNQFTASPAGVECLCRAQSANVSA